MTNYVLIFINYKGRTLFPQVKANSNTFGNCVQHGHYIGKCHWAQITFSPLLPVTYLLCLLLLSICGYDCPIFGRSHVFTDFLFMARVMVEPELTIPTSQTFCLTVWAPQHAPMRSFFVIYTLVMLLDF